MAKSLVSCFFDSRCTSKVTVELKLHCFYAVGWAQKGHQACKNLLHSYKILASTTPGLARSNIWPRINEHGMKLH